jgi:DNA-binding NarL/FixJ family response regulator
VDPAAAILAIERDAPDVVVVELGGSTRRTVSWIERLRRRLPGCSLLVLTAEDAPHVVERVVRAGAQGYVVAEGSDLSEVADAVRSILDGQLYVSPKLADSLLGRLAGKSGRSENADPMSRLTDRELHVFMLIGERLTTSQIADRLGLSPKTIEAHRGHIRRKLGLRRPRELNAVASRWLDSATDH